MHFILNHITHSVNVNTVSGADLILWEGCWLVDQWRWLGVHQWRRSSLQHKKPYITLIGVHVCVTSLALAWLTYDFWCSGITIISSTQSDIVGRECYKLYSHIPRWHVVKFLKISEEWVHHNITKMSHIKKPISKWKWQNITDINLLKNHRGALVMIT